MKDEMLALLVADFHVNNTAWIKFHCLYFYQLISDGAIKCNAVKYRLLDSFCQRSICKNTFPASSMFKKDGETVRCLVDNVLKLHKTVSSTSDNNQRFFSPKLVFSIWEYNSSFPRAVWTP